MKSGLGDENWKFFTTESNKKKVKIPESVILFHYFRPQKEKARGDFGKKAKNK